jgi:hypothetical protein
MTFRLSIPVLFVLGMVASTTSAMAAVNSRVARVKPAEKPNVPCRMSTRILSRATRLLVRWQDRGSTAEQRQVHQEMRDAAADTKMRAELKENGQRVVVATRKGPVTNLGRMSYKTEERLIFTERGWLIETKWDPADPTLDMLWGPVGSNRILPWKKYSKVLREFGLNPGDVKTKLADRHNWVSAVELPFDNAI